MPGDLSLDLRNGAPRGVQTHCKGWGQEAMLRLMLNNLDPAVAERPEDLVVYGGTGRAARSWADVERIAELLQTLADDETLLIQSGRAAAVVPTHEWAPRVLMSNAMVVPEWATHAEFTRLESMGLTMFGQMTAGSWSYIGSQGILQSTFETFSAVAERHFSGSLAGTLTVTAGLGGMGGAQPLAVTMNGGTIICAEVDNRRIRRRLEQGYLDRVADSTEEALGLVQEALQNREPLSVAVREHGAQLLTELAHLRVHVDIVTDQTPAHDPLYYLPDKVDASEADKMRAEEPDAYIAAAHESIVRHVEAMIEFAERGAIVFEYGNSIRAEARLAGLDNAFSFPGFIAEYIRPLFCEARGHCRWIALSGDPRDIEVIDDAMLELLPDNASLQRWLPMARAHVPYQGLPARTCMLGMGEREKMGLRINELVRDGFVSAPVAISREHLDAGSVASPYRETEGMKDGSDAIADWPILNSLVNAGSGATMVAVHHGGGVGIGRSIHSGHVIVADGTPLAEKKITRTLRNDPALGVIRYVDAGYLTALECARTHDIQLGQNPFSEPSVP